MDVKSTTQLSTLPDFFAPDKLAAVFPVSKSTLYRALRRGGDPQPESREAIHPFAQLPGTVGGRKSLQEGGLWPGE